MATRVAVPLTDAGRQMRASVHNDVALPPLALAHIIEDRDAAWRLHDPPEAADTAAKLGQSAGQTTLRQRTVLGTIIAIHTSGVIARRSFLTSRRGGRIVLPAATDRRPGFTRVRRLQQGEVILALGGSYLLRPRSQRWNPAVGWID